MNTVKFNLLISSDIEYRQQRFFFTYVLTRGIKILSNTSLEGTENSDLERKENSLLATLRIIERAPNT